MMGIEKIQFPLELIQISLNYQIKNISVSEIQPMLEIISEMVKKNFNEKKEVDSAHLFCEFLFWVEIN